MKLREWIDCDKALPKEIPKGIGTYSERVEVMLKNGEISEDWLINGKWVLHCKREVSNYPVKWREKCTQ